MNTQVAYERDNKKFNKWDQELVHCGLCDILTAMTGTKRCDRCWELEKRIEADPELAKRILARAA